MARTVEVRVKGEIRELKEALKQARSEIKKLTKDVDTSKESFGNFGEVMKIAFGFEFGNLIGIARRAIVDFAKESVKMALDMEMAWQAFSTSVGKAAYTILNDMREASRSMVTDLGLVKAANRALLLGINENQLPELMEIARVRAKYMGIEVTKAFEDITLGIGRQSRLILDNLGIILNIKKVYEDYAHSIGKTREQLTEFEKRIAMSNAVVDESRGMVEALSQATLTNKEKWQQLTAAVKNWLQETGIEALSLLEDLDFALSEFGGTAGDTSEEIFANKEAWRDWREEIVEDEQAVAKVSQQIREVGSAMQETMNSLRGIGSTTTLVGEREKNLEILQKEKELTTEELNLMRMQEVPLNKKAEIERAIREGKREGVDVLALEKILADMEAYEKQKEKVDELRDQIKELKIEKKLEFDLVKEIEEERGNIMADALEDITITKEEFEKMVIAKVEGYTIEMEKLKELKKSMDEEIEKLKIIRSLSKEYVVKVYGKGRETTAADVVGLIDETVNKVNTIKTVKDAFISKDGNVTKIDSRDNIVVFKESSNFMAISQPLYVENVIVLDGREVARSVGRYEAERLSRSGY